MDKPSSLARLRKVIISVSMSHIAIQCSSSEMLSRRESFENVSPENFFTEDQCEGSDTDAVADTVKILFCVDITATKISCLIYHNPALASLNPNIAMKWKWQLSGYY